MVVVPFFETHMLLCMSRWNFNGVKFAYSKFKLGPSIPTFHPNWYMFLMWNWWSFQNCRASVQASHKKNAGHEIVEPEFDQWWGIPFFGHTIFGGNMGTWRRWQNVFASMQPPTNSLQQKIHKWNPDVESHIPQLPDVAAWWSQLHM